MNTQQGEKNFILLSDYSSKYKVSVSTLRRKIKNEDIKYVFEDGRYFICDEPMSPVTNGILTNSTHQRNHRPSLDKSEVTLMSARTSADSKTEESEKNQSVVFEKTPFFSAQSPFEKKEEIKIPNKVFSSENEKKHEESVLTIANRLLAELKKAYSQILQGKEEQIFQLREEITDLKTLVRVLETENSRLTKK